MVWVKSELLMCLPKVKFASSKNAPGRKHGTMQGCHGQMSSPKLCTKFVSKEVEVDRVLGVASTAMAMAAVPKVARAAKVAKAVAMMATAKYRHSPLQVLHQIVGCRLPELATGTERKA